MVVGEIEPHNVDFNVFDVGYIDGYIVRGALYCVFIRHSDGFIGLCEPYMLQAVEDEPDSDQASNRYEIISEAYQPFLPLKNQNNQAET
jgi:hypothetical protein